jgi:hypothetical protein
LAIIRRKPLVADEITERVQLLVGKKNIEQRPISRP